MSERNDRRPKKDEGIVVDEKVTVEQREGDVVLAGGNEREHGRSMEERLENRVMINVPSDNPVVERIIERVNRDDELYALWVAENVNAERLGMTDHGPVHVKIVMNIATKLLRLLLDRGVAPGVAKSYGMGGEEAEVVVVLAALLHDTGMSIHRMDHESFSLFVAQPKVRQLLDGLYDVATATVLRAEVLHAIIAHRSQGMPLTLEAGIVRVADALDMAKGRSRIPFQEGSMSIHSISAAAIESVKIDAGETKPIRLVIRMSNSAGVFQIDQLFREKLSGSGLEAHVEVEARVDGDEGREAERRLVTDYRL